MNLDPITVPMLAALSVPFIEAGVETLFFSAFGDRIYVGKVEVRKISGSTASPSNIALDVTRAAQDMEGFTVALGAHHGGEAGDGNHLRLERGRGGS